MNTHPPTPNRPDDTIIWSRGGPQPLTYSEAVRVAYYSHTAMAFQIIAATQAEQELAELKAQLRSLVGDDRPDRVKKLAALAAPRERRRPGPKRIAA